MDPHAQFDGVWLHAVAGDQVFLGRVRYEAGTRVKRHSHPEAEQIVAVVEGEVEMTIGDESRVLRPGDLAVANRGVEHELYTEGGVEFFEALSPVPRDHIPNPERDLVLGSDGGSAHVER